MSQLRARVGQAFPKLQSVAEGGRTASVPSVVEQQILRIRFRVPGFGVAGHQQLARAGAQLAQLVLQF